MRDYAMHCEDIRPPTSWQNLATTGFCLSLIDDFGYSKLARAVTGIYVGGGGSRAYPTRPITKYIPC